MVRRFLCAPLQDSRAVSVVEFGLIAPILLLSVMGIFDVGYNVYTQSLLRGAIQKAARDSTIEGARVTESAIDARISRVVHQIVPNATLAFTRRAYTNFADVSQPEDFTDLDGNGECDNNEPFEDANGNGAWDTDRGRIGMGGARDAVLYNVEVSYRRAFPLAGMIGLSDTIETRASTVLRNQPFAAQETAAGTGNCAT